MKKSNIIECAIEFGLVVIALVVLALYYFLDYKPTMEECERTKREIERDNVPLTQYPSAIQGVERESGKGMCAGMSRKTNETARPARKAMWRAVKMNDYEDERLNFRRDVVAETLYREARGEGWIGIKAVASVILNRSNASGKTLDEVCLASRQFSCWNGCKRPTVGVKRTWAEKGDLGRNEQMMWEYCKTIARMMVDGKFVPVVAANHYYAHGKCRPSWATAMKKITIIGNHTFGIV